MRQNGLTIVEIAVAIVLATLVTLGLLPLLFNLFTSGIRTTSEASMQEQANSALAIITNQIARSKKIATTTSPGTDTGWPAPSSGWRGSGSVLILEQIATTLAPQNPNRKPVSYAILPVLGCGILKYDLRVNYVFYVHEGVLYQRTVGLNVPVADLCDGATSVYQKTSCLTCSDKPKDIILARNVDSFTVEYTPKDPEATNPYANTDVIYMSLKLKTGEYEHTSAASARLLLAGSN